MQDAKKCLNTKFFAQKKSINFQNHFLLNFLSKCWKHNLLELVSQFWNIFEFHFSLLDTK